MTLADLLREARDPSFWRARAPSLTIASSSKIAPRAIAITEERTRLRDQGWARVIDAVPRDLVEPLAKGLRALHDARIPTPLLYVFDEPWSLAATLAPVFTSLAGAEAFLLPDVWAWLIEDGGRGWAPHRGVDHDVRDATGAPTLINVWIALSNVTERNACMHVVPLGASEAIPLPVPAGALLAWNANLLHWGGAMEPNADPRLSMSFTITTVRDAKPFSLPNFDQRVGLVADMLVTYASHGVDEAWLEWARVWSGMRDVRP